MVTLTANTVLDQHADPNEVVGKLTAQAELFVGQAVQEGTAAASVRNIQDLATAGFAGLVKEYAAAANDVISIVRRGRWRGVLAAQAVAAGEEGDLVYLEASPTANNNPADSTYTSLNNLPWGRIETIITAGIAGSNEVVIYFEADGLRSV